MHVSVAIQGGVDPGEWLFIYPTTIFRHKITFSLAWGNSWFRWKPQVIKWHKVQYSKLQHRVVTFRVDKKQAVKVHFVYYLSDLMKFSLLCKLWKGAASLLGTNPMCLSQGSCCKSAKGDLIPPKANVNY